MYTYKSYNIHDYFIKIYQSRIYATLLVKKLLYYYAYEEKSNKEQRNENMENTISWIKCTDDGIITIILFHFSQSLRGSEIVWPTCNHYPIWLPRRARGNPTRNLPLILILSHVLILSTEWFFLKKILHNSTSNFIQIHHQYFGGSKCLMYIYIYIHINK